MIYNEYIKKRKDVKKMKVAELIKMLETLPKDADVYVRNEYTWIEPNIAECDQVGDVIIH